MLQNCPKCGSYNIQITTGGIICNDCEKIPIQFLVADQTEDNHNLKRVQCPTCGHSHWEPKTKNN